MKNKFYVMFLSMVFVAVSFNPLLAGVGQREKEKTGTIETGAPSLQKVNANREISAVQMKELTGEMTALTRQLVSLVKELVDLVQSLITMIGDSSVQAKPDAPTTPAASTTPKTSTAPKIAAKPAASTAKPATQAKTTTPAKTAQPSTPAASTAQSSEKLISSAWSSLNKKDYAGATKNAEQTIKLYSKQAAEQQAKLKGFAPASSANTYWALNDVATAHFIIGKAATATGDKATAKENYQKIIDNYSFAQAWDSKGWFWKVAQGAKDELAKLGQSTPSSPQKTTAKPAASATKPATTAKPSEPAKTTTPAKTPQPSTPSASTAQTSQKLISSAWSSLNKKDYAGATKNAAETIKLYSKQAAEQQAKLKGFAPASSANQYWALNDVATAHFILAKAAEAAGDKVTATTNYQKIIDDYSYAQCWDSKGFYWKVAEGAQEALVKLSVTSSSDMAASAWSKLNKKDYAGAAKQAEQIIGLFSTEAAKQQGTLKTFAPASSASDYWALNDVATAHFILAKAATAQKDIKKAKENYQKIIDDYSYAQCWDTKGWFWKLAQGAKDELAKLGTSAP